MAHYMEFLQGLMLAPRAVSAPTPSGPVLAAVMAAEVGNRPGLVVELGSGSGTVTEALVKRGISPSRLVAIECAPYFAQLLQARFPLATVIEGDAFQFETHLPEGAEVAAIVSGVPLLNFPLEKRAALIEAALKRCGLFVQLSYGWTPPVPAPRGVTLHKRVVWRNFPPAHVWTYTR